MDCCKSADALCLPNAANTSISYAIPERTTRHVGFAQVRTQAFDRASLGVATDPLAQAISTGGGRITQMHGSSTLSSDCDTNVRLPGAVTRKVGVHGPAQPFDDLLLCISSIISCHSVSLRAVLLCLSGVYKSCARLRFCLRFAYMRYPKYWIGSQLTHSFDKEGKTINNTLDLYRKAGESAKSP